MKDVILYTIYVILNAFGFLLKFLIYESGTQYLKFRFISLFTCVQSGGEYFRFFLSKICS